MFLGFCFQFCSGFLKRNCITGHKTRVLKRNCTFRETVALLPQKCVFNSHYFDYLYLMFCNYSTLYFSCAVLVVSPLSSHGPSFCQLLPQDDQFGVVYNCLGFFFSIVSICKLWLK